MFSFRQFDRDIQINIPGILLDKENEYRSLNRFPLRLVGKSVISWLSLFSNLFLIPFYPIEVLMYSESVKKENRKW